MHEPNKQFGVEEEASDCVSDWPPAGSRCCAAYEKRAKNELSTTLIVFFASMALLKSVTHVAFCARA